MAEEQGGAPSIPRTYESGPSEPVSLADGPGTWVEVGIDASPEQVWPLITDIDLPAQFSEEFLGATWDGEAGEGGRFVGRNRHPAIGEWEVPCFVDAWEPGRIFGWRTSDPDDPGARWRFQIVPEAGGAASRLRFSVTIGPGPSGISVAIAAMPDREPRILERRLGEHHANMTRVVEGVRDLAERRRLAGA